MNNEEIVKPEENADFDLATRFFLDLPVRDNAVLNYGIALQNRSGDFGLKFYRTWDNFLSEDGQRCPAAE
jgi:hypothetical protein